MPSDELANAFKNGKTLDSILGLSEANMSYLMQKTGKTADEIATLLAKNEIDLSNINGNNVDGVLSKIKGAKSEIWTQLATNPNEAFFWSGRSDGIGGAGVAENIAKSKNGVTLESTIKDKGIDLPEWDFNDPESIKAWEEASAAYAEQVTGEVRAVVGNSLREGNIWENVELPRLIENKNVTKITTIDPKTLVETVIFERK